MAKNKGINYLTSAISLNRIIHWKDALFSSLNLFEFSSKNRRSENYFSVDGEFYIYYIFYIECKIYRT